MKNYLFVLLILLFISCQSKNEEKKELIPKNPIAKVEIEEKNDSLIYKIEENTVVIGGDTLKIEAPFIYSFDGTLDNKKVQIHISNRLTEEYGGYWKSGRLYIDGEDQIFGFGLVKNGKEDFYTGEASSYDDNDNGKTICKLKLYNLFTDEMFIECIYNKKAYKIYPSKKFPSYKCFDKIDYTLFDTREAYKKGQGRDYTPSRDYTFLGEILSNDKNFEALSSNLKYLSGDSLSIKNHDKWKHNFDSKKAVKDEDNYASESLFVSSPIFIDSNIYVVYHYWYNYMGGAHGLYRTSYDNYEVSTGKKIEIGQLLDTKNEDFIDFYENRIRSEYGDGLSDKIEMANTFYILPTGITFSYAPYELVGFAGGEPEIFFSYEELKSYILKNTILDNYN